MIDDALLQLLTRAVAALERIAQDSAPLVEIDRGATGCATCGARVGTPCAVDCAYRLMRKAPHQCSTFVRSSDDLYEVCVANGCGARFAAQAGVFSGVLAAPKQPAADLLAVELPARDGSARAMPRPTPEQLAAAMAGMTAVCGKPCDFECGGTCELTPGHAERCRCAVLPHPETVVAKPAASVVEKKPFEELNEALQAMSVMAGKLEKAVGRDLGGKLLLLSEDQPATPELAKAVKALMLEAFGKAGFEQRRDKAAVAAGKIPTGAQLQALALTLGEPIGDVWQEGRE